MSSSYVRIVNPKAEVANHGQAMMLCISAASGLQDVLKSNLGPKGTLKMLVSGAGDIKITKDGKILLSEMQIQNPAAMMMARAAVAQDDTAGDGSTTNILLMAEILKLSGKYIGEGIHPRILIDGISEAANVAQKFLETFKIKKEIVDAEIIENVVHTSIRTKLSAELSNKVAGAITEALLLIRPINEGSIDLHAVEIQKMQTRKDTDTCLIKGLVLDHGARHPDMPSSVKNAYVLALNVSLEYEKSEINSGFFYNSSEARDMLVDSERKFLNDKLNRIIKLKNEVCQNSNKGFVIINQKGIDPLSLDVLARNGIMALRRAKRRNMERLQLCCGCTAQNSVDDLDISVLGYAGHVYEKMLGEEKFTFIEEVKGLESVTILITAPNQYTINQINDAIRDGLRAAKNTIDDKCVVPGAGAFYISLNNHLNTLKNTINTNSRIGLEIFAEALLVIPKTLAQNSGLNLLSTLIELQAQNSSGKIMGLDLSSGKPMDPVVEGIYDNYTVIKHILSSCAAIASNFLLVDEIIKAGKSSTKNPEGP